MQLYRYICEQLQFFPLAVQRQQYELKGSQDIFDERMKKELISVTIEPFVYATLGFIGKKVDNVHYAQIDDQEEIILGSLDNLIQNFFHPYPLIKDLYETVLNEIKNNDLQTKIEDFRQDPTNQIKIILQLLILYIGQEKPIEPTLFTCFFEIIWGYKNRFIKGYKFVDQGQGKIIITSVLEGSKYNENNDFQMLNLDIKRDLELFILAFLPSNKEKRYLNKCGLIEILSFILNKYDVDEKETQTIIDYIKFSQKESKNSTSAEMCVLYGFYLLFVSDLKFSNVQITKHCQTIKQQYDRATRTRSFDNTTQKNCHSLRHVMNIISISWFESLSIEDDSEESEDSEEGGINKGKSLLKLKPSDFSHINNLVQIQKTSEEKQEVKQEEKQEEKQIQNDVSDLLDVEKPQDSAEVNLIEKPSSSTPKIHVPELQHISMYDTTEMELNMIQYLRKRRREIEDDLDQLCEWFKKPMDIVNKMAFVQVSRTIRDLSEDQYQGFLILRPEDFISETDVWFVGDIHGDLLGLYAVLDAVKKESKGKDYRVVFLGDLVDDGHDMIHVVYEIVKMIQDEPNTYCWLAGNHDEGTIFDEHSEQFISTVTPARFADWLNNKKNNDLGLAFIELVKRLPRAIFFPKGLMCSHAGIPHSDVVNHESFTSLSDMDQNPDIAPLSKQDFAWTRLNNVRKRRVNRVRKGCSFGYKNFEEFSQKLDELGLRDFTQASIQYIVRGHDHCEDFRERWDRFSNKPKYWQERALTINNMCFDMRDTQHIASLGYVRSPVIAKWNSSPTETPYPEPFALKIPESLVKVYSPLCSKNNHINKPSHNHHYVNSMDAEFCAGMVIDPERGEVQCKEPIFTKK